MAHITGTTEWSGRQHSGPGGTVSMTRPGLNTHSTQNTGGCGSPDHRGQLNTGADANPITLACWSLEFFWSCDAADAGVPGDVGHGKDVHGHFDDGDQ